MQRLCSMGAWREEHPGRRPLTSLSLKGFIVYKEFFTCIFSLNLHNSLVR